MTVILRYVLITALCCVHCILFAQTDSTPKVKYWKLNGNTALNFVQSNYSNWSTGGENSMAGAASSNLTLKYKKENLYWENTLILGYGLTYQGDKRSKNDDKIDFATKLGYKAFKNWNYTLLASFKTQFDLGYASYPIKEGAEYNSKFMSPGYTVISLGMDYKPNDNFSLLLSPLSGKFTFVNDERLSNLGAFGVKAGETKYYEFGAYIKTVYTRKLHQNINLRTSLDLFSNLLKSPEHVDVNWDLTLDLKVTKFISAKLGLQMLYDDDTKIKNADGSLEGAKVQFKEVLGVGFSYNF